ncbi:MAG TPA: 2-aminoethylphosphonate--pyruvate transaminase [Acetobacteraceae bacterium]|jgi:2-aminoethylphosphonate-pyruvate transaminase|nr:2-aminoethylphosphonate--pyruvate transaminase [Acetobacteraceae bacterium]
MKLLIPGPVNTRPEVQAAMTQDLAPWDNDFRPMYASVRERVRAIAGGTAEAHVCLVLQGCGHFSTEAALRTFVPAGGRILIPMVGAYADRMARLAREAGRVVVELPVDHQVPLDTALVAAALAADPSISHVGTVYSETGSGVIHDPVALGAVVRAAGRRMIVDAVSAFGALPFDISAQPEVDAMVFTSNKCFEGMPGLGFCVAPIERLLASVGNAGSWSLDFADVYAQTVRSGPGSFRFTPPAQVLAAFKVALDIYDAEGGQPARLARYTANRDALYQGVAALGLRPYLGANVQGPIVMNVHAPADPAWNLQAFVDGLKARGYLISNFYNTPQPSFRVGLIGAITPDDMRGFVAAIDAVLPEIGVRQRGPAQKAA